MTDVIIFFMGCFVSLIVASAVGLLFWGAANEPRGSLFPNKKASDVTPQPAPATGQKLEAKSPA